MTVTEPRRVTPDDFNDIPSFAEYPLPPLEPSPFSVNGDDHTDTWKPVDLADPKYAIPPRPPELMGLIYGGKRHVISGPPESAKTLVAYILALEAIRTDRLVAVIDFEMGPEGARRLLDDLGATTNELRSIHFVSPETPPRGGLETIIERGTWLAIVDAAIGAYDASGLDDNARKDVQQFARMWIDPLWKAGVSSLLIDHVTKDKETRGKFTIGSERKLGAADVHLSLEAVKTITRGETGIVKVHVHKDRAGFLPRPTATVVELHSDPEDHAVTWTLRDPHPTDADGGFRPTGYMERVSVWLEKHPDGASRNEVELGVGGGKDYVRRALDVLTAERHIDETKGARNARIVTLIKPYSESLDPKSTTSADLGSTSASRGEHDLGTSAPPDKGAERASGEVPSSTSAEVDAETQELIDTYVKPTPDDGIPF